MNSLFIFGKELLMDSRILVIEDDEAILAFLRRGLAYDGYIVDTATEWPDRLNSCGR